MRLRIDIKARNDVLLTAIERKYGSIAKCAKALHKPSLDITWWSVHHGIYQLVALRPGVDGRGRRRWRSVHIKVAELLSLDLGIPQEEILPQGLLDKEMPELRARITTRVDLPALLEFKAEAARHLLPAPSQTLEGEEMREKLRTVLHTLTQREEDVIRSRYGIDRPEETLDQIAARYNLSRERIRQHEAKALRKLQHPVRMNHLTAVCDLTVPRHLTPPG